MLNLKDFPILDRTSIKMLRGGVKRKRYYFLLIMDTQSSDCVRSVIRARLWNQKGSQRSSSYRDGYEPFGTSYGLKKFDIAELEFPVPRISLINDLPSVEEKNWPARIVDSMGLSNFQRSLLTNESERFKLQCKVRQRTSRTTERFWVSFTLLGGTQASNLLVARTPAESRNLAEEFEIRLSYAKDSVLRDLSGLLKIPDAAPTTSVDLASAPAVPPVRVLAWPRRAER